MADDYTLDLRLCDDAGMVSDTPIVGETTLDTSYLARHDRLRNIARVARGEKATITAEAFRCTGSAHLAGEHMRCTSPAHVAGSCPEDNCDGTVGHVGPHFAWVMDNGSE